MRRLVFGCGYLGAKAANLWKSSGDKVFAVTRSEDRAIEFNDSGLWPIVADVTRRESLENLPKVDTVLVAVGLDRSQKTDARRVYVDGLKNILEQLPAGIGQIIYVSSTGVFGAGTGTLVNEDSKTNPIRAGAKASLEAEHLLWASSMADRGTVLRLAGIYGPGRVPSSSLIRQQAFEKLTSSGYLNLIHRDDAAAAIVRAAEFEVVGETILISDGHPVLRQTYYETIAGQLGISLPDFSMSRPQESEGKRINNSKMLRLLKPTLKYPSYREGLADLLP